MPKSAAACPGELKAYTYWECLGEGLRAAPGSRALWRTGGEQPSGKRVH